MSNSSLSDAQIENLLSAVTDALLAEENDVEAIIDQYRVSRDDMNSLISVIRKLHVVLVGVQPSRRFVRRLKQDLVGVDNRNVISRVRHLPPRVQIAAGVALVAGFMLLSRRRMIHEARQESQEIAPV